MFLGMTPLDEIPLTCYMLQVLNMEGIRILSQVGSVPVCHYSLHTCRVSSKFNVSISELNETYNQKRNSHSNHT